MRVCKGNEGLSLIIARNEVAAEVMRIKTALALARNTAITRRTTITVCPSPDGISCRIENNAEGTAWTAPLAIFEGQGVEGDKLLRTFPASKLPSITYRNDNRPVRYQALGRSGGYNGTFRLCGKIDHGAKVIVNNVGRVRTERDLPTGCHEAHTETVHRYDIPLMFN